MRAFLGLVVLVSGLSLSNGAEAQFNAAVENLTETITGRVVMVTGQEIATKTLCSQLHYLYPVVVVNTAGGPALLTTMGFTSAQTPGTRKKVNGSGITGCQPGETGLILSDL